MTRACGCLTLRNCNRPLLLVGLRLVRRVCVRQWPSHFPRGFLLVVGLVVCLFVTALVSGVTRCCVRAGATTPLFSSPLIVHPPRLGLGGPSCQCVSACACFRVCVRMCVRACVCGFIFRLCVCLNPCVPWLGLKSSFGRENLTTFSFVGLSLQDKRGPF
jgi:hypothetical protein